jgi:hypothetical protein
MQKRQWPYVVAIIFVYFAICESFEWLQTMPQQPADNLIFVHSGWEALALLSIGLFCLWVALPSGWLTRRR